MPEQFISLPIETQPELLAQLSFDYMDSVTDGDWDPSDGQLDVWVINAIARQAAELRDVAADVPASIFRYFGATLMGIPPLDATAATATVTFNAKDSLGYTIPAGYTTGVRDANADLWGFQTTQDIVIPPGTTSLANVQMTAVQRGAESSGLGANGTLMELITSLDVITSVVMSTSSSGGQDAEEDDDYLDRLAVNMVLQAPRPILPVDFANFSLNQPGVGRALAIDGYDAVALTYNNARTITVAVTDVDGNPLSAGTKSAVQTLLQNQREVNFLVYVIDPTYTTIDVNYNVTVYSGWDTTAVRDAINAALTAYLSPGTWGQPAGERTTAWETQGSVKQLNLAEVIGAASEGVKDVNSVTLRTGVGSFGTADVVLAGAAPLPRVGVLTGTVA